MTMEIKASAAKALSDWQAFFATESMNRAKEIARNSETQQISISHLNEAALETIERLKIEIQRNTGQKDDQKAA